MAAKSKDLNKPTLTDALHNSESSESTDTLTENYFAVSVLRDFILPDLLDKDTVELLYWAGKNLSRQLILDMESLPELFAKAGFGKLEIVKQTKSSYTYKLNGPEVEQRFDTNNDDPEFSLETGIIAETVEKTIAAYCLGTYTVNSKAKSVTIKIQIDRN
ncbi:DUF2507 domain-containing protein [Companilactobacillus zhachilii]|jgi:Protein of unknown function (DUF2507).|uniref:DUF2507 domain-containing protein n=1 Tax=Companilactobacillus zhachilii TaxID=2304606 RepID=A0A386PPU5_9LACO|nr:DUF2507 domain-containing protein [Companilactobacillus zhachilii]AYE37724.1 DUF2507 domain-containing protein [Companilactobacillus zhachilii]MBL3532112.1 YslB family protein [Companilactobacillus zhachilii]